MSDVSFRIHTYGCKVNTYDSGLLASRLGKDGFTLSKEHPQVHILNTCAVTKEATREAVRTARRLKSRDPLALVVVTGCAAQVDTEEFTHVPGVDLVVANSHKGQLEDLIRKYYSGQLKDRVHKSNIFKKEDLEGGGGAESEHTRAFLKIQDGCNSFCTFCVIPFARGKSRSLPVDQIVRRARELFAAGHQEIVLTGVHIADYRDGQLVLEDLVEAVLENTEVPRIRLSSLEPGEVSERLLDMYSDRRLCPHFHMSIQSANTKVLFDMKRQYTADAVTYSLEEIARRVPDAFVGMDVIAGFPGEGDEEFLDSYRRLERLPWTRLHVFPYSQRPGTFATRRSDQVHPAQIKKRAQMLRELSEKRWQASAAKQIGRVKAGLTLKDGRLLSRDYWPIQVDASDLPRNQELQIEIKGIQGDHLVGAHIDARLPLGL
ncbi:MAG TPA: tRNA (N(6)-L-threonylcarbamoyladenosine(37)-C(2))-methylthiotransferase MtaB [Bdellovibrionales bacterium]|nr:tRNA (N(6)-L-threonylcarbamoyladenosine(37)-C(2))-methylthiotransferase MtaB [Bdellovibrionales bacterium]